MIQTTRDFRSDLGGWSILWRDEDADRWGWFIPKISGFFKTENFAYEPGPPVRILIAPENRPPPTPKVGPEVSGRLDHVH